MTDEELVLEKAYLAWKAEDKPDCYREGMSFGEFASVRLREQRANKAIIDERPTPTDVLVALASVVADLIESNIIERAGGDEYPSWAIALPVEKLALGILEQRKEEKEGASGGT